MKSGTLAMLFMPLFAAACATPISTPWTYQAATREISEPPLNVVSVVAVGDSMVRQGRFAEQDIIRLSEELSLVSGLGCKSTLRPGDYLKTGEDQSGEHYYPMGIGLISTDINSCFGWQFGMISAVMLRDDGRICSDVKGVNCVKATGVEKMKTQEVAPNAFQQTLIYNGKVGDKINIGYREFSANIARPAFNNDVEYDLRDSTTIGYKGALIEVLEATNQSLRYRVLKNFNTVQ